MSQGGVELPDRPEDAPSVYDVEYWLGVYKSIDEVPDRYRVEYEEARFDGEDTWEVYLTTRDGLKESTKKNSWYPCGRRFKQYMSEEVGIHHALAHPHDIEGYLQHIKDGGYSIKVTERSMNTVYYQHLSPLKVFFNWLVTHVNYPHVYNPVLLAAHEGGITRNVWDWHVEYRSKSGDSDE